MYLLELVTRCREQEGGERTLLLLLLSSVLSSVFHRCYTSPRFSVQSQPSIDTVYARSLNIRTEVSSLLVERSRIKAGMVCGLSLKVSESKQVVECILLKVRG